MRNTKIIALSKEFCLFLLLLNHWVVCHLRIALLADSRNYQSQGHAIAFDRSAQSVLVVIVRGSTTMLLARVP